MPYQQVQPRSAALAVIASFFIPGLGSMINDRIGKGVLILGCQIVASILCLVVIGFVLAPAVWIWGMIAANNDVRAWNQRHGIMS
jgi:TM2 domain-containing membrane protein YozV